MGRLPLAIALCLAACTNPRTEVVVNVSNYDLVIPDEIEAVILGARNLSDSQEMFHSPIEPLCRKTGDANCLALPMSVTLIPGSASPGDAVEVTVQAGKVVDITGATFGTPVIDEAAQFTFTVGQSQRLDFILYRACRTMRCAASHQACDESGSCASLTPTPVEVIPDLAGGVPPDLTGSLDETPSMVSPDLLATIDAAIPDLSTPPDASLPAKDFTGAGPLDYSLAPQPDLATSVTPADLTMSMTAQPDLVGHPPQDLAMSDLAMSDLAMPDLAMPDFSLPDFSLPDLRAPAPTLTRVTPSIAKVDGSQPITLTGAGFSMSATVSVGGSAAAFSWVSATSLVVNPPSAVGCGAATIVVTNPDGQSVTRSDLFSYGPCTSFSFKQGNLMGWVSANETLTAVIAADFDNDGKLDFAMADGNPSSGSVLIGRGDGTGNFAQQTSLTGFGFNPKSLAADYLDGDNLLDIVVPSSSQAQISVFLGEASSGAIKFKPGGTVTGVPTVSGVTTADFDRKGKRSVGFTQTSPSGPSSYWIGVARGDGAGNLAPPDWQPINMVAGLSPTAADLDNKNGPDLAAISGCYVTTLLNSGSGPFPANVATTTAEWTHLNTPVQTLIADVDGDKNLDLLVVNSGTLMGCPNGNNPSKNTIAVYLNTAGTGNFLNVSPGIFSVGQTTPVWATLADFNLDGILDVITVNENLGSPTISVLLGDGKGSFSYVTALNLTGVSTVSGIATGDFDSDGKPDFVVAATGLVFVVFNRSK